MRHTVTYDPTKPAEMRDALTQIAADLAACAVGQAERAERAEESERAGCDEIAELRGRLGMAVAA